MARLELEHRLVGRIGSRVRVIFFSWQINSAAAAAASVSFQKNARLVGRLRSGPCLVADGVDVVYAYTPLWHCSAVYTD